MGFLKTLLGRNGSQSSTTPNHQYIIANAHAFAELCRKIAKGGSKNSYRSVTYQFRATATSLTEVYATYTVHDDDWLEYAHNRAMENNRFGVEYAYNNMIEKYKLTTAELRSFPDVTDFMDFLRGGISGYNSCQRSGSDIKITQELGCIQSNEKSVLLSEIAKYILNSNSEYRAKRYGSTALSIEF